MRRLFLVFAKLVGIFWTAHSLSNVLSVGLWLVYQSPDPTAFGYEFAYRVLNFLTLFLQLCLAVSLVLGTKLWATLVGIPRDRWDLDIKGVDALAIGIKLLGIYFMIQAVPTLAMTLFVTLELKEFPASSIAEAAPTIQSGMTFVLGVLCALNTQAIVGWVTKSDSSESTGSAQPSSGDVA